MAARIAVGMSVGALDGRPDPGPPPKTPLNPPPPYTTHARKKEKFSVHVSSPFGEEVDCARGGVIQTFLRGVYPETLLRN